LQGIFISEEISGAAATPLPTSSARPLPKIPPGIDGIQVNFCKNPTCANYGVPPSLKKGARRSKAAPTATGTEYRLSGSARMGALVAPASLMCLLCKETIPLKSNLGVAEEVERISSYLWKKREASCPNPACLNNGVPTSAGKSYYAAYGKSGIGSQRYKCHGCQKTFSIGKATRRQQLPHKNKDIFKALMNKVPFNRICELMGISMRTLYDKIDFIHRQCLAFSANREQRLLNGMEFDRLYIAVDRQSYSVNWTHRKDRRNVVLQAVGSADLDTGYVFAMNLNFDPDSDANKTDAMALGVGDHAVPPSFRRFARLWLTNDYLAAVTRSASRKPAESTGTLTDAISAAYNEASTRADVEDSELQTKEVGLPKKGMQVHSEYTLYGHFFHLKRLLGGVKKIRFFLDQDSGMRAACLAAFQTEIAARKADAFFVRIHKEMMVWEKRKAIAESRANFAAVQAEHPTLKDREVKLLMMKSEMDRMETIGPWRDKWAVHPFPNSSETLKRMCYLTDFSDYDADHKARLYMKATLHPIDRFFQQVRRRLSLLERPIGTASKVGRTWYGYSAYLPENIEKVLAIFRVYYNYCLAGQDGKTPAMRLGLARAVIDPQSIIYYIPS